MAMVIAHNLSALNTYNQLNKNSNLMNSSLEKLSSGYSINSAADNAAGLAISEKMRGQIRGLDQASSNAQDGISMVQTAEGALSETTDILQRMRELAVQSSSDTLTTSDRSNIQDEVDALVKEIDNISNTTEFNTKNLLDGSMAKAVTTAVGNVNANVALATSSSVAATASTDVTALTDTDGTSLGITVGDTITVEYMVNGEYKSSSVTVTSGTTISSLFAGSTDQDSTALVSADIKIGTDAAGTTKDGITDGAITATASVAGSAGAVYGLTITVTDSDGTKRSDASTALSSFSQAVSAADVSAEGAATILIGANSGQDMTINIEDMGATALGVNNIDVSSQDAADVAISVIDTATATVSSQRAKLGAIQNRLDSTINNLTNTSENLTSAESAIRDVDMASEMATYTKLSVITQAATAMLAQANKQPQQVLTLLQ